MTGRAGATARAFNVCRSTRRAGHLHPTGTPDCSCHLCHEVGSDATAYSAVTKVLADRLTSDGQQALRRSRSHSRSGHQPEPADLFPDGRDPELSAALCPSDRETGGSRRDQQRRRAPPAWLLTQAERKPPSAGHAVGRRLLDCTNSGHVCDEDLVAAFVSESSSARRPRRCGGCFGARARADDALGDAGGAERAPRDRTYPSFTVTRTKRQSPKRSIGRADTGDARPSRYTRSARAA